MDSQSCMNAIKNRYDSLTGTEKKVADYILKNHGKVSSMSVAEFSEDAGVTQASVVRCCKSLGFQGYANLKMALAVELSKNRQLNYTPYIYPTDDASTILDKIFSANVKTLHDTAEKIDRSTLQYVVDLLDHAHSFLGSLRHSVCCRHG